MDAEEVQFQFKLDRLVRFMPNTPNSLDYVEMVEKLYSERESLLCKLETAEHDLEEQKSINSNQEDELYTLTDKVERLEEVNADLEKEFEEIREKWIVLEKKYNALLKKCVLTS